jgi:hypothetical protein
LQRYFRAIPKQSKSHPAVAGILMADRKRRRMNGKGLFIFQFFNYFPQQIILLFFKGNKPRYGFINPIANSDGDCKSDNNKRNREVVKMAHNKWF